MTERWNLVADGLNGLGQTHWHFAVAMFVQVGILVAILLLLDLLLLRRTRAAVRYGVWSLVLLKLLLPVSLSSPVSVARWLPATPAVVVDEPVIAATPAFDPIDENESVSFTPIMLPNLIPMVELPERLDAETLSMEMAAPVPSAPEPEFIVPTEPPLSITPTPTVVPDPIAPKVHGLHWQAWLFVAWALTVVGLAGYVVRRARVVRRMIARSSEAPTDLVTVLRECLWSAGMGERRIDLLVSKELGSPAICGFWRPMILLPSHLVDRIDHEKLRLVFLHEIAHWRRGDVQINCLQTVLQIFYFYNPLVWLANLILRRTREQAVDEAVLVRSDTSGHAYGETLLDIASLRRQPLELTLRLVGVVESRKALTGRITRILTRPIPKKATLGVTGLAAVLLIGALTLPMAAREEAAEPEEKRATQENVATDVAEEPAGEAERRVQVLAIRSGKSKAPPLGSIGRFLVHYSEVLAPDVPCFSSRDGKRVILFGTPTELRQLTDDLTKTGEKWGLPNLKPVPIAAAEVPAEERSIFREIPLRRAEAASGLTVIRELHSKFPATAYLVDLEQPLEQLKLYVHGPPTAVEAIVKEVARIQHEADIPKPLPSASESDSEEVNADEPVYRMFDIHGTEEQNPRQRLATARTLLDSVRQVAPDVKIAISYHYRQLIAHGRPADLNLLGDELAKQGHDGAGTDAVPPKRSEAYLQRCRTFTIHEDLSERKESRMRSMMAIQHRLTRRIPTVYLLSDTKYQKLIAYGSVEELRQVTDELAKPEPEEIAGKDRPRLREIRIPGSPNTDDAIQKVMAMHLHASVARAVPSARIVLDSGLGKLICYGTPDELKAIQSAVAEQWQRMRETTSEQADERPKAANSDPDTQTDEEKKDTANQPRVREFALAGLSSLPRDEQIRRFSAIRIALRENVPNVRRIVDSRELMIIAYGSPIELKQLADELGKMGHLPEEESGDSNEGPFVFRTFALPADYVTNSDRYALPLQKMNQKLAVEFRDTRLGIMPGQTELLAYGRPGAMELLAGEIEKFGQEQTWTPVLVGTITGKDGTPVDDASLRISGRRTPAYFTAKTDENGHYEVKGLDEADDFDIGIDSDRWIGIRRLPGSPTSVHLVPDKMVTRDFQLEPACRVRVRVVDEQGRPVSGARLRAAWTGDLRSRNTESFSTNKNGLVTIGGLTASDIEYQICPMDSDWGFSRIFVTLDDPNKIVSCELVVQKGKAVTGRAVCSDGLPPAGWRVKAMPSWWSLTTSPSGQVIAEDGTFSLQHILPGKYDVSISIPRGPSSASRRTV